MWDAVDVDAWVLRSLRLQYSSFEKPQQIGAGQMGSDANGVGRTYTEFNRIYLFSTFVVRLVPLKALDFKGFQQDFTRIFTGLYGIWLKAVLEPLLRTSADPINRCRNEGITKCRLGRPSPSVPSLRSIAERARGWARKGCGLRQGSSSCLGGGTL